MKVFTNLKNTLSTVRNSNENGKYFENGLKHFLMNVFEIFSKISGGWKPKSELLWNWKVVHSVTVLFQHLWQAFCQQNFAHKPLKISNEFKIFQNFGMELFSKPEFADFSFSFEFLTVFFEFFRFVKTFIRNFNFWN